MSSLQMRTEPSFFPRRLYCYLIIESYWDGSSPSDRGKFEHDLYFQTRPEWAEIKPRSNMNSNMSPNPDASPMPDLLEDANVEVDEFKTHVSLVEYVERWTGLLCCSDKCVVYKKTSDVVFFITGSGEYSELICIFACY